MFNFRLYFPTQVIKKDFKETLCRYFRMNRYQNGKIYKVVDVGYNMCYIGSTCKKLYKRFSIHKCDYKQYVNGKKHFISIFSIFDEYGVENGKIELIENYPCQSKEELQSKEGQYQQQTDCVNKFIAGRTSAQYEQDNKEKRLEKSRNHYHNNRESELNRKKEYRKKDTEKTKEQDKQYYQRHKEKRRAKYTCHCGAIVCFDSKYKHEKTKKDLQIIETLNQNNPQE